MWFFRRKSLGEKIRNPIQGEFFATDAIEGPAQALVRESVQNSIDARAGGDPVRIRIALFTGDDALPATVVASVFDAAWPHYKAKGNGLRAAPEPGSACPFLVIEDFGTKGLTGDVSQSEPDPDPEARNPFFLFFRAEGLSAKAGADLGRWGIGKFVFPRSSLVSTHFGMTVRHDDRRRLLMGATTLKAHRIEGEEGVFSPDGLYGAGRSDDFVQPIGDTASIEPFCRLFRLSRTTEPGLSVVVPYVDPEITYEGLVGSAVEDYFLPVLEGRLELTVTAGDRTIHLSATSLEDVLRDELVRVRDGFPAIVRLARLAIDASVDRITLGMPDPSHAVHWSEDLIPPDRQAELQTRLGDGSPVIVRVPLTVRPKNRAAAATWFDIALMRDATADGRPVFVREGIVVSDVRGRRAREIRSIVAISDKPLATLLGDSENPAHTQWQKDGSNFRGRYIYGPGMINFVMNSVGELVALLNRRDEEADPSLTVDHFHIASQSAPDADVPGTGTGPKRQVTRPGSGDHEVDAAARPTRIRIEREAGGFTICSGTAPPSAPYLIEARCAYDIRSGNPLKKWDPADFSLGADGVCVDCEGPVRLLETKGNWALLRVDGAGYRSRFTGFDESRDLYVKADVREAVSADPKD